MFREISICWQKHLPHQCLHPSHPFYNLLDLFLPEMFKITNATIWDPLWSYVSNRLFSVSPISKFNRVPWRLDYLCIPKSIRRPLPFWQEFPILGEPIKHKLLTYCCAHWVWHHSKYVLQTWQLISVRLAPKGHTKFFEINFAAKLFVKDTCTVVDDYLHSASDKCSFDKSKSPMGGVIHDLEEIPNCPLAVIRQNQTVGRGELL